MSRVRGELPLIRRPPAPISARTRSAALVALAALAATPAVAAAQQPSPAASKAPPASNDGMGPRDVYIEAEQLVDDRDSKVISAEGKVEVRHLGRTLRADKLVYDTVSGVIQARGHVTILNADGTSQYGDEFTLDEDFRAGVALGFSARMQDNVTMVAGAAIKRSDTVSELRNARYTPCPICKADGEPKTPSFQVQASEILQDAEHHVIYYKNAIVRVFGVPVMYFPVFWHPDPTAERRAGLLTPKIQYSKRRGFSYQQPYLFTLSPSSELIVAPQFNTAVNSMINAEYTKRFYSGELNIRAGYAHDRIFSSRMEYGDDTSRSYILAKGRFNIDKYWDWGFGAERATDPTMFRRYGVRDVYANRGPFPADTDRLISQLYTTRTDSQSYVSLSAVSFQSARIYGEDPVTKLPIYESSRPFPVVAPLLEARYDPNTSIFGGRLRMRGSAVLLTRNNPVLNLVDPQGVVSQGPLRVTNPLATNSVIPGLEYQDSRRATAQAEWRRDLTLVGGVRLTPYAQVRGDVFSASDARLVSVQNGFTGSRYGATVLSSSPTDGTTTRGSATVGVSASWPFIRQTGAYTAILEPVVQAYYSPRQKRDLSIPNEDSVSFEFDESTLFSSNRSPGFDLSESGARMNVGGRASVFWGAASNASLLVGRTFRDSPDPAFLATSGVRDTSSDWVTYLKVQPIAALTFFNRARLDADTLKVRREEVGLTYAVLPRIVTSVSYNYNESGLVVGPTGAVSAGKTQDLDLVASVFPFKHWGASALMVRDFEHKIWPVQQFSLIYRDECIRLDLIYTRDQVLGAAIGTSTSVTLRLTLATLGDKPLGARRSDSR
jgi:LPS-assembly protein